MVVGLYNHQLFVWPTLIYKTLPQLGMKASPRCGSGGHYRDSANNFSNRLFKLMQTDAFHCLQLSFQRCHVSCQSRWKFDHIWTILTHKHSLCCDGCDCGILAITQKSGSRNQQCQCHRKRALEPCKKDKHSRHFHDRRKTRQHKAVFWERSPPKVWLGTPNTTPKFPISFRYLRYPNTPRIGSSAGTKRLCSSKSCRWEIVNNQSHIKSTFRTILCSVVSKHHWNGYYIGDCTKETYIKCDNLIYTMIWNDWQNNQRWIFTECLPGQQWKLHDLKELIEQPITIYSGLPHTSRTYL